VTLYETARLLVRHFRPDDAEALFAVCSDPVVTRWVGDGTPLTLEQCEKWIQVSLRNYETKGFGASAVIVKETGEFAGYCGIVYAPERAEPEIIYGFAQRWWGQGFASEVVPPMLEYGLTRCGLGRVIATIDPENAVSRRVAEKAGMRYDHEEVDEDGFPTVVYAIGGTSTKIHE
jgi:RimJ/RimL family protein N-acetyltransferase